MSVTVLVGFLLRFTRNDIQVLEKFLIFGCVVIPLGPLATLQLVFGVNLGVPPFVFPYLSSFCEMKSLLVIWDTQKGFYG